ncbi:MAG: hypothetical protein WCP35_21050 [Verrucomicrobiota bacterium]
MASHPQITPQIEQLIRLSAASRSHLSQQAVALRQRFDVPGRVLQSLRGHPLAWFGGGLATALGTTLLLRHNPASPKRRRSWRGLLGSLALSAARPVIKNWLASQLQHFLLAQLRQASQLRPRPNRSGHPDPQSSI